MVRGLSIGTSGADFRQQEAAQLEAERQRAGSDQIENENAQSENDNAQIENENAQSENGNARSESEKPQSNEADEGPEGRHLQVDLDIEEDNIRDGKAAVKKLLEEAQTSSDPEGLIIKNAMYRSDLGFIDFKWGTPGKGNRYKGGYGISHILEKRNAENGRGNIVLDKIVQAIAKAEDAELQHSNNLSGEHNRVRLHYGDTTVILSKDPGENHWLLTGWENRKAAANAIGEGNDSSDATTVTPTRTRRNGDATANESILPSAGNSNKNFSTENSRAELEQEYKRRHDAYMAASDANDTEFDYRGESAWMVEAEKQIGKERAAQIANGEIEARDTANRRSMTAEERKNAPPDLGDENTVFAGNAGPMANIDIERDYIQYGDTAEESRRTSEAIQRLRDKGKYVNLSYKDLEGFPESISGENYKAESRKAFQKILERFLGKDLELRFEGNSAVVYLSFRGINHAVVAEYSQFKAGTFSKLEDCCGIQNMPLVRSMTKTQIESESGERRLGFFCVPCTT